MTSASTSAWSFVQEGSYIAISKFIENSVKNSKVFL